MKKATALILVLVVMIIVGLGTAAILQAMISYSQMRLMTIEHMQADYLAEAGVQYAIWQLSNGDAASPVNLTLPELAKDWTITVTKTQMPDGSYEISATCKYPGL